MLAIYFPPVNTDVFFYFFHHKVCRGLLASSTETFRHLSAVWLELWHPLDHHVSNVIARAVANDVLYSLLMWNSLSVTFSVLTALVGSLRWAEKELHMMKLFFDNLQHYIQEVREHRHKFALWVRRTQVVLDGLRWFSVCVDVWPASFSRLLCRYSHSAEVQVRLQFLTCVFSTLGSPDHFSKNRLYLCIFFKTSLRGQDPALEQLHG